MQHAMLKDMGIIPLCEGIEICGERLALEELGVDLCKGLPILEVPDKIRCRRESSPDQLTHPLADQLRLPLGHSLQI